MANSNSDSPSYSSSHKDKQGSGLLICALMFFIGAIAGALGNHYLSPKVLELPREIAKMPPSEPTPAFQAEEGPSSEAHSEEQPSMTRQGDDVVITAEMRNRILSVDFTKLLQDAKIRRYIVEGEIRGLKLSSIRTGSLWEKAGFQEEDVIESVNGVTIAAGSASMPQLAKLPGMQQIELGIIRDGRYVTKKIRVVGSMPK